MKNALITACFICFTGLSHSQTESTPTKKGVVFGTSIGLAYTIQEFPNKSQNNTGFGLDLKIGYMIKPNMAILLMSNVTSYKYSGIGRVRMRDFGILAPSVQYWFHEKIWILGGVGLGMDSPVFFDIEPPDNKPEEVAYFSGLGLVGGIGYEFLQGEKRTFDVKFRCTYRNVKIQEGKTAGVSFAILIGVNFY